MNNKYILSLSKSNELENTIKFDNYYLNHNYETSKIFEKRIKDKTLIIIGEFVDCRNSQLTQLEIVERLINTEDLDELIFESKYLAGRYLILYGNTKEGLFSLPDPISSIPVNYTVSKNMHMISSHAKFIAENYDLKISEEAIEIRKEALEPQHPLPYNITMYKEVKFLVPNHLLNIKTQKKERFYPKLSMKSISMDDAVEETIEKTHNILDGFLLLKKLSLPLTSGKDSRLLLALLKDRLSEMPIYTYYFDSFTDESGDIQIPKQITEKYNLDYHMLKERAIDSDLFEDIKKDLSGMENKSVLNNGYTYSQSELSDYSSMPGDVVSITKSQFGKALPEKLATTNYFVTKTHNYSNTNKEYVKLWVEETKELYKRFGTSQFDLFVWEHRFGRWMSNSIQNYDYLMNQTYIFNCRYLIEMWVSIPRKERTNISFHEEIIRREWPELLELELNPDEKLLNRVFNNSYMFYLGSFLKHIMLKYK